MFSASLSIHVTQSFMNAYHQQPDFAQKTIEDLKLSFPLQKIETNWCVITGGPCSGKTSLCTLLKESGYNTFPETAEVLIKEGRQMGLSPEEVRADIVSFQDHVMAIDTHIALTHPTDRLTFFDTSLIDNLVYRDVYAYPPDENMPLLIDKLRYRRIFLLDQLPHEINGIRIEDEDMAKQINATMAEYYRSYGYEVHRIPAVPPRERLAIILASLQLDSN